MLPLRRASGLARALPLGARHMSRIGKKPIPLPDAVKVTIEPYPTEQLLPIKPLSERIGSAERYFLRNSPTKDSFQMFGAPQMLRVEGPLGSLKVPVHSYCNVQIDEGDMGSNVVVSPRCEGKTKLGKTMWGSLRGYIAGAVLGVSQGYRKELELHGVGYRARIEPPGGEGPKSAGAPPAPSGKAGGLKGKAVAEAPDRLVSLGVREYGARTGAQAGVIPVPPDEGAAAPGDELVLRVGFGHEVRVKFPPHLQVVTPSPTSIIITGIDRQSVGQAAARVRLIKKPDPYKGKGIRYVGEVVRLKQGKRR